MLAIITSKYSSMPDSGSMRNQRVCQPFMTLVYFSKWPSIFNLQCQSTHTHIHERTHTHRCICYHFFIVIFFKHLALVTKNIIWFPLLNSKLLQYNYFELLIILGIKICKRYYTCFSIKSAHAHTSHPSPLDKSSFANWTVLLVKALSVCFCLVLVHILNEKWWSLFLKAKKNCGTKFQRKFFMYPLNVWILTAILLVLYFLRNYKIFFHQSHYNTWKYNIT